MMDGMGASGASVHVSDDGAIKYAPLGSPAAARIDAQAEFLCGATHRFDFLPRVVRRIRPGSYRMELLTELPTFIDDRGLVGAMVGRLRTMWNVQSSHRFDYYAHLAYVRERAETLDLADDMEEWGRRAIRPGTIGMSPCCVHGDPTIDNCMLRHGGELVVIDPIPPTHVLPSVRALDIGKIIQSAMGYEEVACGRRPTTLPRLDDPYWSVLGELYAGEWELCMYMAAVHFLRLIPYTPQHSGEWALRVKQLIKLGAER